MVSSGRESITDYHQKLSKLLLDNPNLPEINVDEWRKEYMSKQPRVVEIHNTYPNGLVGTDYPYWACKAFVEMCDRKAGYSGYFPVKLTDNAISLWRHGVVISMIIFSVNEEERIIDICSAYTVDGYRKQGYYLDLFEEFKLFRDTNMPDYDIHSEVLVDNIPRMSVILEKTGREKISENWSC